MFKGSNVEVHIVSKVASQSQTRVDHLLTLKELKHEIYFVVDLQMLTEIIIFEYKYFYVAVKPHQKLTMPAAEVEQGGQLQHR